MINYQRTPKPRNYLARGEQRRLLWLVLTLGLVIILMIEAGDPRNWGWFFALSNAGNDAQASAPVDTRLEPPPPQAISGTFVSPAVVEDDEAGDDRYFPGVKATYLKSVRDDTTFRYDERQAWFNLLDVLNQTDEAALRRGSVGRITFAQLFEQSDEYRGELVTIRGTVRRARHLDAPKNDVGIKGYYQICVSPADHPSSPIMVYCLRLPEGFPTGMDIRQEAELSGFFFKRWAYKATDAIRTAPVLVAKTLHWQETPVVVKRSPFNLLTFVLVVGVAAAMSGLVLMYVLKQTPRTESK